MLCLSRGTTRCHTRVATPLGLPACPTPQHCTALAGMAVKTVAMRRSEAERLRPCMVFPHWATMAAVRQQMLQLETLEGTVSRMEPPTTTLEAMAWQQQRMAVSQRPLLPQRLPPPQQLVLPHKAVVVVVLGHHVRRNTQHRSCMLSRLRGNWLEEHPLRRPHHLAIRRAVRAKQLWVHQVPPARNTMCAFRRHHQHGA